MAYLFLLFIPLNHLGLNLKGIDHGKGNFGLYNTTRAITYPIFLLGLGYCWFWVENKIYGVIVAQLIAIAASVFLRLVINARKLFNRPEKGEYKGIIYASIPFFGANLLALLANQLDKALLVYLLPVNELGFYVVALSAASVINSLNQSFGIVTFTHAARRTNRTGFPELAIVLRRAVLISIFASIVLGGILPSLLPLIFGAAFTSAINTSLILLPGVILMGLADILNQDFRGQGHPMAGVFARITGFLVFGMAAFFLAQTHGASGIAISYVLGEAVNYMGMLIIAFRFYRDFRFDCFVPRYDDFNFIWRRLIR
jgi:O-antigen/teichoic acid export membrane protein